MSAEDNAFGRGTRRKKLAGYLRSANEMRQSYTKAYIGSNTRSEFDDDHSDASEALPHLTVSKSGTEELVLFPSYARRHTKTNALSHAPPSNTQNTNEGGDADYWRREWEFYEDANAIVDVDVRGWVYSPPKGPMNRKNRILLGIARQLSGIPAPTSGTPEANRFEEKLAEKQAQNITKQGEEEAEIAGRGGLHESSDYASASSSRSPSPKPGLLSRPLTDTSLSNEIPGVGYLRKATSFGTTTSDMSPEELVTANTQLMKRLKPFFSTPAVSLSVTMFFYNDKTSQSRTTHTNDSGHFNFRAALDFVPTHVRVLASEDLSASSAVTVTEPAGVSLISDIDDTIKHSAIVMGAREIFRNAFVRDLGDLVVKGVQDWYRKMANMGVNIHYVSNSPWQMYPLLVTYFAIADLPPGSFHLKQYTGMLQGIFEPVAERKKATLDRIMSDFPERRFILVGDSGEADLELYTETTLRDPKRILAIFIRDVSTTQSQGFFNGTHPKKAVDENNKFMQSRPSDALSSTTPGPEQPRSSSQTKPQVSPEPEDLMSFSDDEVDSVSKTNKPSLPIRQKPSLPPKPAALRSLSASAEQAYSPNKPERKPVPDQSPRRDVSNQETKDNPGIIDMAKAAYESLPSTEQVFNSKPAAEPDTKPQPSRTGGQADSADPSGIRPTLPPRRGLTAYPAAAASYASTRIAGYWNGTDSSANTAGTGASAAQVPLSKREELWNRRLARAKQSLEGTGVILKTWRVGTDVQDEAIKLVERYTKK